MSWRQTVIAGVAALCAGPAGWAQPVCETSTMEQEFRWSREFQGVDEPVTWSVFRTTEFEPTQSEGVFRAVESLRLELPEFRWRFQKYLNSAKLDSCETRFFLRARTPTAGANAIRIPLVVDFERARCGAVNEDCIESAHLIGECRRRERKILAANQAEIDVAFHVGFVPFEMRTDVQALVAPLHGELSDPVAQGIFDQVLEVGELALEAVTGTLGDVSLARLAPDMEPVRVEGGFLANTGSRFELLSEYRLSNRQLCRARLAITDFGIKHRPSPSGR